MSTIKNKLVIFAFISTCQLALIVNGQEIVSLNSGGMGVDQALRSLQTNQSVLHVVAHPDDEDGATMVYCARGMGVRTMLFSITRGEGGANLISDEFFDQLGALRTLEHLKSAEYYGTELFYSRAVDYGYSKTLKEARRQWDDGYPILSDLVEVIRRERPTIMLSRFQGSKRDGHGHHQMAGVISQLAFDAAADPTRFSEQIASGLQPWQVSKLYVNNIRPEWRDEDRDAWTIAIPNGSFDSVLGKTYAQIARYGLGFQRSQGMSGNDSDPGPSTAYYRLIRDADQLDKTDFSSSKEATLFDPPNKRQDSFVELNEIESQLQAAVDEFNFRDPEALLPRLTKALQTVRTTLADTKNNPGVHQILLRKSDLLESAIVSAAGIDLQCYAMADNGESIEFAVPGQKLKVHLRIANQGRSPLVLRKIIATPVDWVTSGPVIDSPNISAGQVAESSFPVRVPIHEIATKLAWHRDSIREPLYEVDSNFDQRPIPDCPIRLSVDLQIAEQLISVSSDVYVRFRDPRLGNVRYPLLIVPPIGVSFPQSTGLIPIDRDVYETNVKISSAVDSATGVVRLAIPDNWKCEPAEHAFQFARAGEQAIVPFRLTPASTNVGDEYQIGAIATYRNKDYTTAFETVTARDLGRMNIYRDAIQRVQTADVQLLGSPNVAYVAGSGDAVSESLEAIGIHPLMLSSSDLASGDLDKFDLILIGVRAYAVRNDLRNHNQRLLDYVSRGGTLIVQYQTPEFDNNFGPFPYTMGRNPEEVSEEDAVVTILEADHPVFNRPNKITTADFENWFEQRGSKFLTTWDDRYTPLLECHDTDQDPQRGGMLIARHGKGVYIYSAYSWHRQLPNGVPGAFRLFANMLSFSKDLAE